MELYDYQKRVADRLRSGQSLILRAPTGAGKTIAALWPFLEAFGRGSPIAFPRKCLYSVPMRCLANQFVVSARDLLGQLTDLADAPTIAIQTGERPEDRRFESDLIFATIDQILSSFLNIPYSLSLRQGNVNAGAVVSSYLVFDEFHLLDPESTLPTTLEMLRILKGITPFLLMTATFSGEMLHRLASLLDATVVTVESDELQRIPTQRDKKRWFHRTDAPLTAEAVLQHHRTRSIVICNTVARAQHLFEELGARAGSRSQVMLLHSRFLREHRQQKEEHVRRCFGEDGPKAGNVILVATQVVEVGLDITCEVMHTELAPASSILQRAGRCARFKGEEGDVHIYRVPPDRKGEPNYAPYLDQQVALCANTWEALPLFDGENMDFVAEQRLANLVHSEADGRMLDQLELARYVHRQKMHKAIAQQEMGLARDLIRSDDSVTVLVHPNPETIDNPYDLEGFSLFFGTLWGQFKEWQETALPNDVSWLLQFPLERDSGEGEDRPVRHIWVALTDPRQLSRSAIYVANPLLAKYDSDAGFRFAPGGEFQSPLRRDQPVQPAAQKRGYRRETYQEHIQRMLDFYRGRSSGEMVCAAARLERHMRLAMGSLDRAVCLAIALHDAGKLDRRWQGWAHEGQARIGAPVAPDVMLAHTDYHPDDPRHRNVEAGMSGSRPSHAGEGAVAVCRMLHQLLGAPEQEHPRSKLMKVVFSAIARHHSPGADSHKGFDLHPAAETTIAQALGHLAENGHARTLIVTERGPQCFVGLLVQPDARDELLAYLLIVRALRLADQGAMAAVNEEGPN